MKRSNLFPTQEPETSREYYGLYQSRDFYKGTSFKMKGDWDLGTHYFHDEYIIDYVSYNGALLVCTKSHLADNENKPILVYKEDVIIGIRPTPYWAFVLSGVKGDQGVSPLLDRRFDETGDYIIWGYAEQPKEQ